MTDIIASKRDGNILSESALEFFITGYVKGEIPDYQAAALLMAVYLNGMNAKETATLTRLMMHSGETVDLSAIKGIKVDKHSTGGVGDKTTLVLTPLVASLGIPVAKMSGKGLGHTGGTVDKMEAFEGIQTELSQQDFIRQVQEHQIAVSGQSGNLVPADKKLYALRDVTATIDHISLIAASIMSKKLASGADAIVLDVKVGNGGFNPNITAARKLAKTMIRIGKAMGRQTVCVLSGMDQPLGNAVGNAIEVVEAIETLKGNGPKDLVDLCLELGTQMLLLSGQYTSATKARRALKQQIKSGAALEKLRVLVKAQGGKTEAIDDYAQFPTAKFSTDILATASGWVNAVVARQIGLASMQLGAGRQRKEDAIDLGAGVYLYAKAGTKVKQGDRLATLYGNDEERLEAVAEWIGTAWKIGKDKKAVEKIVREVL